MKKKIAFIFFTCIMIVSQNIYALAAGIDYDGNNITFVEANENTSSETEETNSINIDALEGIDFFKEEGRESQNIEDGGYAQILFIAIRRQRHLMDLLFPWNGMTLC